MAPTEPRSGWEEEGSGEGKTQLGTDVQVCRRREEIEITSTPQNGVTIRMLRDQKGSPDGVSGGSGEVDAPPFDTLEVNLESLEASRTPSKESFAEGEGGRSLFVPRVSSFSGRQEADERLLARAIGKLSSTTSSRPRFLTLHKRKRRRPPTRGLTREGAILDDLYNGPTQCVLEGAALWDFNAFVLDNVCGGRPVTVLCVFLLHQYNLLTQFALDAVTVWKCFSLIEEGYHASNPYHNAIHAADVTQAMHCYLQENAIVQHLTPFEKLGAIIASVCHDLDHPGVNQPFLIATDNHLAALYNNASVLENHHWRCAMGCLWESGFLDKWSPSQVEELQEMIRSLILATDITRQNEFLTRFKRYQDTNTLDLTRAECRHFSLQIALKCADICNPCRPWETSRQWSQKICDEFYRQGDYERQLHLPVTSMCDRRSNTVANIQKGFIKCVVAPLFEAWDRWLDTDLSGVMLHNLRVNLQRWEAAVVEEGEPVCADSEKSEADAGVTQQSDSSTASSGGASDKESAGTCPLVGRRHSLPLTIPSLLPRTIIRRESLTSEEGVRSLVFETLQMGESVVESVVTVGAEGEESLFPPPSIAAMGEVGRARRLLSHPKGQRRQSLPPLWDSTSLLSRAPLQPLPPTPLQEELPPIEVEKDDDEKKPLLKKVGGSSILGARGGGDGKDTGGSAPHRLASNERRFSVGRRASLGAPEEGDKENVAPPRERGERPIPHSILKTRLWRSLNQEEETELLGRGPKGLFKHLPQNDMMRRRGSAPLLKPEELRGGLRGGAEKPLLDLPKRRGSAPTNQITLQLGSDALRLLSEEKTTQWQSPLLAKENLLQGGERNPMNPLLFTGSSRLVQRRGSVPWEGLKTEHQVFLASQGVKVSDKAPLLPEGGGGLPMGFPSSETHGGAIGGGGLTPHFDTRRGSAGFELLSGLWRLRLEQNGASLCSDESVGVSSSGGATPGTPGVPVGLAPNLFQGPPLMPGPILRRGSLPTDVFIGGDCGRWAVDPS